MAFARSKGSSINSTAIVFATGFDVCKTGTPVPIIGRDGRVLARGVEIRALCVQEHCGIRLSLTCIFTFGP